jgi:acyl phosphate:glycerol-3-phosphate acyltransferase
MTSTNLTAGGLALLAYLLGSIPWGLVLTRVFTAADIRRLGSGNIGATNVARVAGPFWGLATFGGDFAKGWAPVALAFFLDLPQGALEPYAVALALLAVLGHLFPIYTRLRGGGKGVATAAGGFFGLSPPAVLIALGVFGLALALTRRVSVGSLAAAAALPLAVFGVTGSAVYGGGAAIAAVLIFMRHAENIRRLRAGTEPRFRLGDSPDR